MSAQGSGEIHEADFTDRVIRGNLKVTVQDKDTEELLSKAELVLYSGSTKIGSLRESSKGIYELKNLVYGRYTLRLEKAPKGYHVDDSFAIAISEDGETVELTVNPRPVIPVSPDTLDPDSRQETKSFFWIPVCSGGVLTLAFVFFLLRRRKEA